MIDKGKGTHQAIYLPGGLEIERLIGRKLDISVIGKQSKDCYIKIDVD